VPKGLDSLVCAFCGTAHLVRASGGVMFLEEDVREVREGVGRIEASVADIRKITSRSREDISEVGRVSRLSYLDAKRERLESKRAKAGPGCLLMMLLLGVPMVMGAASSAKEPGLGVFIGMLVGLFLVLVVVMTRRGNIGRQLRQIEREMEALDG
jgi:hypothetical protein